MIGQYLKLILYTLLLSCLTFGHMQAQKLEFAPKIEFFGYPFTEFNSEEVTDIQVDQDGFVWIISFSKIYRYDGSNFELINTDEIKHGTFLRFHQSREGKKYVTDFDGAVFFIERDRIIPFSENVKLQALNFNNSLLDIKYESEEFLISYETGGVKQIKDSIHKTRQPNNRETNYLGYGCAILKDSSILITSLSFNKGLANLNNPNFFFINDSDFNAIDSVKVKFGGKGSAPSYVELPNGNYLFSDGKFNLIEFNSNGILSIIEYSSWVIRLFVDNEKNLWVSTYDNGIDFYPKSIIKDSNKTIFLEGEFAFISTQDYMDGLWFYSQTKGLGYIENQHLEYVQGINLSPKNTIELTNENLVISDQGTVNTFDLENFHLNSQFEIKKNYNYLGNVEYDNSVSDISFQKGNRLWVTGRLYLGILENRFENRIDLKSKGNYKLSRKLRFGSGDLFDSIIIVHNKQFLALVSENKVLSKTKKFNKTIKSAGSFRNKVWVSHSDGLFIYEVINNELTDKKSKISKSKITSSLKRNKDLFFSIDQKGLFEFDGKILKEIKSKGRSIKNGHLVNQNDSTFWLFNMEGSFEITRKTTSEFEVSQFKPTGLDFLKKIKGNQEKFFFVINNGSVGQSAFSDLKNSQVTIPKLVVENITTFDSTYSEVPGNKIELDYQNRKLTIDFVVLNFQNRGVEYQYQLQGVDTGWVSTQSNSIVFTYLAPNSYELIIRSRFVPGVWVNSKPIQFTVLKPFWQTWWFIGLCIIVAVVLIYLFLKSTFEQKAKDQKEKYNTLKLEQRALRAQMSPHFIFNIIASLQYLIIEGARDKAIRFLEMFSKSLRNLLDQSNVNAIIVEDEIKFLTEYIELEKFRTEDSFGYKITSDLQGKTIEIPTFLIQPFVENAIKHGLKNVAVAGNLEINFEKQEQFIIVTIADNGIGRAASNPNKKKKQSHGIRLIKERLRIHNEKAESVVIEDLKDANGQAAGTRVKIQIKY